MLKWLFILFSLGGCSGSNLVDPTRLSNILKDIQNDVLGVAEVQTYFDNLKFVDESIDGNELIQNLAEQIRQTFREKIEVVDQIRTAIEQAYTDGTATTDQYFPECCKIEPKTKDYRYKTEVIADQMCERLTEVSSKTAKHLPKSVLDRMLVNARQKPNTRWQYFGSQDGIYFNYPAVKVGSCTDYDPRVRPWYVQGISPEPKDVVIIIDKSGSMTTTHGGKTLMNIAVDAALTVLDSLNPKDRIGIVAFSNIANTPPGELETSDCYKTKLTTAVPVNIKYLKKYLKNIRASGSTYYGLALTKAFQLLRTAASANRKKVVLFLTDGAPTDSEREILRVLETEKEAVKKETSTDVVMFAYGIGDSDFSLLKTLAEETEAEGTKGFFKEIKESDLDHLRYVFATFYDHFVRPTTSQNTHSFSTPYFDGLGLGALVSIVTPCFYQQKVIGVAGTDIIFSELISDMFYFSGGQYSYAFLIDRGTGDTFYHPFMPTLQSDKDDPVILHITALEQAEEFKNVLQSMIRGEEDQSGPFNSKRYLPLAAGQDSGVRALEVRSTYFWKPIPGTNLSLCIVVGENDKITTLQSSSFSVGSDLPPIIYHREIDLKKQKDGFSECLRYGRRGTLDRAVVKFSAQSFEKPYNYITLIETEKTVDAVKDYLRTGRNNPEPKFKTGIREMTLAGLKAEQIWDNGNSPYKSYTKYWTYATTSGIISVKPGLVIDKEYDPSNRMWYQNAVNNKGKLSFTAPYFETFGSGFLVDVLYAIYEGKPGGRHSPSDEAVAVLDASFGMFQFYRLLTETFPNCKNKYRCFIVDNSGFLIIHKDFLAYETVSNLKVFAEEISSIHITELEKGIATDLIKKNILRKRQCKRFKDITTDNFYEINLSSTLRSSDHCLDYQLSPLDGTNAYLGVINEVESNCRDSKGTCDCPTNIYTSYNSDECLCPYKSKLQYNYCKNEFPYSSIPLCAVPSPLINYADEPEKFHGNLKNCFNEKCTAKINDDSCSRFQTCSWCIYDKDTKTFLGKPYCTSNEKCYGGLQGNSLSSLYGRNPISGNDDEKDDDDSNVVLIVCLVIAGVIIALVLVVYIVYRSKRQKNTSNSSSATVVPPATAPQQFEEPQPVGPTTPAFVMQPAVYPPVNYGYQAPPPPYSPTGPGHYNYPPPGIL